MPGKTLTGIVFDRGDNLEPEASSPDLPPPESPDDLRAALCLSRDALICRIVIESFESWQDYGYPNWQDYIYEMVGVPPGPTSPPEAPRITWRVAGKPHSQSTSLPRTARRWRPGSARPPSGRDTPDVVVLFCSWPMGCRPPILPTPLGSADALSTSGPSAFCNMAWRGWQTNPAAAAGQCCASRTGHKVRRTPPAQGGSYCLDNS